MREPDRDELLEGVLGDERERLLAVHQRLVAAGPPPELPPSLVDPPAPPRARVVPIRRRRFTALAAAAAVAVAVFGAGYVIGGQRDDGPPVRSLTMSGRGATATLAVFGADDAGNWPMKLTVSGLQPLPAGAHYELWLTRDGRLADSCGTFDVAAGETVVRLNAPYRLREYSGWVVTRAGDPTVLLRTATL